MANSTGKKRQRWRSADLSSGISSTVAALIDTYPESSVVEASKKLRHSSSYSILSPSCSDSRKPPPHATISFHDPSTADVILRITSEDDGDDDATAVLIHLHSWAMRRSNYFGALLSSRWQSQDLPSGKPEFLVIKLPISPSKGSLENYLTVLRFLYHPKDAAELGFPVDSASLALDLLPAALHILFEDLVIYCVTLLEAVPWTEEEETRVLSLIPHLNGAESEELLARMSPTSSSSSEDMLQGLISQAIHNYPNAAYAKHFVAILLRDMSSRESARTALERAFEDSLKALRESLDEYSSPDFRGDHNETEAKQRANLQNLFSNGRHLCWLVERMIELKVADKAVREWSEQPAFTADLERAFRDDAWRDIVPGLPTILLRCTSKIAAAVSSGTILAARQVRMKLVKHWLPVLALCRENGSSSFPAHKTLFAELEETFLKIISTLPLQDAQILLQQCLGFSTRCVDDCKHLRAAFNTWFRRAGRR